MGRNDSNISVFGLGSENMEVENLIFETRALLGGVDIPNIPLQVGDILVLDHKIGDPLSIQIGEENCFLGSPGLSGIYKAVRIDERIHS